MGSMTKSNARAVLDNALAGLREHGVECSGELFAGGTQIGIVYDVPGFKRRRAFRTKTRNARVLVRDVLDIREQMSQYWRVYPPRSLGE